MTEPDRPAYAPDPVPAARRRVDRAVLVTNRTGPHSIDDMLEGLHGGLAAMGFDSRLCLVEPDGRGLERFLALLPRPDDAEGCARTVLVDVNAKMRFEATRHLRKFSFITDHPYAVRRQLAETPDTAILGCIDRTHPAFLRALGLPHRAVFFPHAGPDPDPDPRPMTERDIEVLFAGRLDTSPHLEDLRAGLEGNPEPVRRIVVETAERAAAGEVLLDAFRVACAGVGVDPAAFDAEGLCTAVGVAAEWATTHNRLRLLANSGPRPVHVVGTVHRRAFARVPDNLVFLGERPFAEVTALMGRARIVANRVTIYVDGSHERIWCGMAAGAAIATDPSPFVEADFAPGRAILRWPDDAEGAGAFLDRALSDLPALQALADAARPTYAERHTWRRRAAVLDRALNAPVEAGY